MKGSILVASIDGTEYLKFNGIVRYSHCAGLEAHIDNLFKTDEIRRIVIDLGEAEILDSTALGLLARVAIELRRLSDEKPVIFLRNGELKNIIKRVCFDQVFELVFESNNEHNQDFEELSLEEQSDEKVLNRVVNAHKSLALLSIKNESLYRDITKALN